MKKINLLVYSMLTASCITNAYADGSSNSTSTAAPSSAPAASSPAPTSPVTGTFDITNNYVFRGISNSDNNPAVQGGFTYTFASTGIYFNLWGSNVDFLDPHNHVATVEFDTIAGIANDVGKDFHYDINIDRYNYPRASSASYDELITALTYKIFTATLGYSTNVYGSHKKGTYYNGAINYDVTPKYALNLNDVTVMAAVGHYILPESAGLFSYTDYMLGVKKTLGQYVFMLQWTGTNGEARQPPLDNDQLVATVQVNF